MTATRERGAAHADHPLAICCLLNSPVRRRIIDWLFSWDQTDDAVPGADVAEAVDTQSQQLSKHRPILETFGVLNTEGEGYILHEPTWSETFMQMRELDNRLQADTEHRLTALFSKETRRALADFFLDRADPHEHLSKSKLSDKIDHSRQAVGRHLPILTDVGLVAIDTAPGHPTYYPETRGDVYQALCQINNQLTKTYRKNNGSLDVR